HVSDLESSVTTWRGQPRTVEVGPDDRIILGLPVGVLPYTCGELLRRSERWRDMVERVPSIPTYAVQLWLNDSVKGLGWQQGAPAAWEWLEKQECRERLRGHPPLGLEAVLCGYDQHLNAWADMSHLIGKEEWPVDSAPRSIAYFCGTFSDGWKPSSG